MPFLVDEVGEFHVTLNEVEFAADTDKEVTGPGPADNMLNSTCEKPYYQMYPGGLYIAVEVHVLRYIQQ